MGLVADTLHQRAYNRLWLHVCLTVNNILVQRNRGQEVTSAKIVDFNAAIRLNDAASTLSWVGAESISPPEVFEVLKSGLITLSLPVHSACQVCGC